MINMGKRAGLGHVTLQGLRHTHSTLLMELGVNPRVVQERQGHSSPVVTLDIYSHVLPGMQDQAIAVLDQAVAERLVRKP